MKIINARLRGEEGLRNIYAGEAGTIDKIVPVDADAGVDAGGAGAGAGVGADAGAGAGRCIDAEGHLVIPPFIDPHVHLDAVLSAADLKRPNLSGTLIEAIGIWNEWKEGLTEDILLDNAREVMKWYVANGVLHVRTHADCTDPSMRSVNSMLRLKEEMKGLVDIQVVAFPQNGVFASKGGEALMRRALDLGADVVGGAPHIELTHEDGVREVEFVYDMAEKYGRPVDIHCDETGDEQSRFVEVMAKENILRGMEGRAAASHTTAMHNYNNDYAYKLVANLARADMDMIANPFDNSVLQNRTDGYPRRRGVTRVDELLAAGVNVCIGHDSIMDPWYSMGKADMVMAANLLAHFGHMNGHGQLSQLVDMITGNSAKTLRIKDLYGIKAGNPANFVILDADDDAEVIRLMPECLYVIRDGKVVSEAKPAERRVSADQISGLVDFKR
jgi:cytosine deaminase